MPNRFAALVFASLAGLASLAAGLRASSARAQDTPQPPQGIWELAGGHELGLRARVALESGGLLVVSDLERRVAGVRPDSGLRVWSRELVGGRVQPALFSLATSRTPDGDVVLAVEDGIRAYRADVGSRLWEVGFTCEAELCDHRVVFAGPIGGLGPAHAGRPELMSDVLLVAKGGSVQSELVRLDPRTGRPIWPRAASLVHPRRVVIAPSFIAAEEAVAPFAVVLLSPEDGRELGRWERRVAGQARPSSELFVDHDRLIAVDLRPTDGALAHVVVVGAQGDVITERQVPRPAPLSGHEHMPVEVHEVPPGLAFFTPLPAARMGVLSLLRLEAPWTARTEVLNHGPSGAPASGLAGQGALRFGTGQAWFVVRTGGDSLNVNVIHASRSGLEIKGFPSDPGVLSLSGEDLLLVAPFQRAEASLVTVRKAALHAFGAPELAGAVAHAVLVNDDLVLVTRGARAKTDRIERLVFIEWAVALERLKAAYERGADLVPLLGRLSRFYPMESALGSSVKLPGRSDSVGALSDADLALVAALRDAWLGGDPVGTLDGMRELIERESERPERRVAMINAFAVLVLDLVLAPGGVVRTEIAERLVGLARVAEFQAQRCRKSGCEVAPPTLAVYAATMALIDEPLAGADLLLRVQEGSASAARLELGRRALHLLRKSAGALRTDTSRQMLVSGLRFFLHFDEVLGADVARASELLDLAGHDVDAARELEGLLSRAEGARAAKKGAGPALCQLACEAAEMACGEDRGRVSACEQRCGKSGAVRFATAGRATADPRWFCR